MISPLIVQGKPSPLATLVLHCPGFISRIQSLPMNFIYPIFCTEIQIELLEDSIDKINALRLYDALEVCCELEEFLNKFLPEFVDDVFNFLNKLPYQQKEECYALLFGEFNKAIEERVKAIENFNQLTSDVVIKNNKTRAERERQQLVYRQWADAEFSKIHAPEDLDRAFRTMMFFEKPISGAGRPKEVRYHKKEWKEPLKTMKKTCH